MAKEPVEELRLAGMLIEAADGKVDWTAYPDQAAQELKALIEAKLAGQALQGVAEDQASAEGDRLSAWGSFLI